MLGNTSPENQEISQGPRDTLISISREALILSASLLEYCQCFLREDVFLIFVLGSVSRNTVPRAVFANTLTRERGVYRKI